MYAGVFGRCYGLETMGLRYFNVFGPRQDPEGAYAAVIPKWIADMIQGNEIYINGTGETSRDFCKPTYRDFRPGDIMHSHADITKAETLLGYHPTHKIEEGLDAALEWYRKNVAGNK